MLSCMLLVSDEYVDLFSCVGGNVFLSHQISTSHTKSAPVTSQPKLFFSHSKTTSNIRPIEWSRHPGCVVASLARVLLAGRQPCMVINPIQARSYS